jgi:tripartite-type tricarboxylate transporter receptor subunit TctC
MKLPHRRQFLRLAAAAAALPAAPRLASAQTYPSRPVRIIVPFAAGGPSDIAARLIGQALTERLGQQVIVENRPGAGSNIGTEVVVRAPADGYTLLAAGNSSTVNATLYEKLSFNFIRDVAPVAGVMRIPMVVTINPSIPAKTIPEFIALAKANPGKLSMASGGNGSASHITGELFKLMAGVNLQHVPYRGEAPALTDLLGGQVQVMFPTLPTALEHIRSSKLRALAATTAARLEVLPDVPTVGDFVPGYEASAWIGIVAPKNTAAEVIDKLNSEINAGLAEPKLKARFGDVGSTVFPASPGEFGRFIADETEKWGKVVKFAGIRAE